MNIAASATSPTNMGQRPPPIPPPKSAATTNSSTAKTGSTGSTPANIEIPQQRNESTGSTSTICHRTSLRHSMSLKHLSIAEQQFLHHICENGNEVEVQTAHDNLLDADVFFPVSMNPTSAATQTAMLDVSVDESASTIGWVSDVIQLNFDQCVSSGSNLHQSESALFLSNLSEQDATGSSKTAEQPFSPSNGNANGSERRMNRLKERRASIAVHLWKAHENGLGISKQASRRSLFVRSSSANVGGGRRSSSSTSSSQSANQLTLDPDIFRPTLKPTGPTNAATRPRRNSDTIPSRQQPPMPKMRPVVGRMRSESAGNRKSVTFHKDVLKPFRSSTSSINLIPPMLLPRRSSSASSIPSLHPGAPITSPTSSSSVQSVSSVPSIRMAHSIRSNSMASILSDMTETDGYRSKDDGEEKKTTDYSDTLDCFDEESSSKWKSSFVTQESRDGTTLQDAVKLLHTNDPTAPLQLAGYTAVPSTSSDPQEVQPIQPQRRVMMRKASMNAYQGEGVEVTDVLSADDSELYMPAMADSLTMKSSNSFDDLALQINSNRASSNNKDIFRRLIRRSFSEDSTGIFRGKPLMGDNSNSIVADIDESWNTSRVNDGDFDEEDEDYYDSWKVVEDEYENGYGGGGTLPFRILGTSADDVDAHPHVLSPPLLESLQAFVPLEKSGDNFWMKYSMVRDGNTLYSFLQRARGSKHTILAIETVDGEVFGAFTAEPWRKSWNYFGNGESFLWRMRHSRHEKCHSIIDQAHMESEIDVYPFIGMNNCIQLCSNDQIAVGGGTYVMSPKFSDHSDMVSDNVTEIQDRYKAHEWGFGLTIESDFLHGTSSPCLTFGSPSLSTIHSDGSLFEIMNIELWTLTPCTRLEDAEKLELGKLFLESHSKSQ